VTAPGPHGGDGRQLAARLGLDPADVIDLSASLNPFAPDVASIAADLLGHRPDLVTTYPDPTEATDALAAALGVDRARLVLTNGGAEAIALVASVIPEGMVVEPEFSLYRRHLAAVLPGAPRWRSNPSNPLGVLAGTGETAAVWDEAFHPLATGRWSRGDEDCWRLGSLTKLWACPGLRLGYAVAPDEASARTVRDRQPRWAVNGLAAALIPALLGVTDLAGWHTAIVTLRRHLVDALTGLGLPVTDTDANWVLVRGDRLRERLAPTGVVIRDATSFGLPGTYRVALPRPEQLDRVVDAFARTTGGRS
jgi:histidinol-phosphate/aromatic aminotransferase/cobyric acid decarboxylase-like protein